MELVSCSPVSKKAGGIGLFRPRIKVRDMIQLFMHLEQLYAAGVPMLDALADIRDSTETSLLKT
jgi:type IV pilus assembly protein PilC